ncbi:MAG: DUF4315 family protein [Lentisphaeria bacterium]|nr:DUF4315 family protein [Lentisphaeria bacterium]
MNKKVVKLRAERANNDEKIAALQSRNEEIDRQIIELENTDIIGMVRESGLTPDMLAALIQSIKQNPASINSERTEENHVEE